MGYGYLSLIAFLTLSSVHLMAHAKGARMVHRVTKPFLIPLLYLSLFLFSDALGRPLSHPALIALVAVFYTVGDILLLDKGFWRLFAGALSFAIGHGFMSAAFLLDSFSPVALALGIVVFAIPFGMYMRKVLHKRPAHLWRFVVYGSSVYAYAIAIAASFSPEHLISSCAAIAGVVMFGISDSRIVYNLVNHRSTSDFTIMWTYLAANALLASALLMR